MLKNVLGHTHKYIYKCWYMYVGEATRNSMNKTFLRIDFGRMCGKENSSHIDLFPALKNICNLDHPSHTYTVY